MSTALRYQDIYATPEEYLAGERVSQTKHEYLAGFIYAMAGGSRAHNRISRNVLSALTVTLQGKTCEPFGSDMRVRIRSLGDAFYYYPDVSVECSGRSLEEIEEPSVIFEVLSPDTERTDRGDKMVNYRNLPSMSVYVLIDQYRPAITVYRRESATEWTTEFIGDIAASLDLPEIDCAVPLAAIYDRVFPAD